MTNEQTSEDLLVIEDSYVRASVEKRLANYLIDLVVFYFLIMGFGFIAAIISPTVVENLTYDSPGYGFIDRIVFLGFYAIYMSIIEALFKGKSTGKLFTKNKAVNLDGSRISISTAFARGFSRAVPFCAFSPLAIHLIRGKTDGPIPWL